MKEDALSELSDIVFLFDVDNTLFDNDQFHADFSRYLLEKYDFDVHHRFWKIFEQIRSELGYADYFGAIERYRIEAIHDQNVLYIANWLVDYPFNERLYPDAIAVVQAAQRVGVTAILSDGDAVFQPHKIQKSGLWAAFCDNVLIYIHKEMELADVERHFPAMHYVLIDDKPRVLESVKQTWADRVTTVFPLQGHYAKKREDVAKFPPADITVNHIGDLLDIDFQTLVNR